MLLQFSVENFKSFKELTVLSLEGSTDNTLESNYVGSGKNKVLKVLTVFGANAAGKSNIFHALTSAILTIRLSVIRQVNEPLVYIVPFKFSDKTINKPTMFEFVFVGEDNKKYVYGFSATRERIAKEYLYVYNTIKPSLIFERVEDEYKFSNSTIKSRLLPLTKWNTSNKLFLATATQWNSIDTKIPYLWIAKGINTYSTDFGPLLSQTVSLFENDSDDSLKAFTTRLLHEADINIDDYKYESKEQTNGSITQNVVQGMEGTAPVVTNKEITIHTIHSITDGENTEAYELSLLEESQGTRNLFLFSPVLKRAFETGETLCIDEFDTSIHPILIEYLIGLFNNPTINKANAQLIMSTHSVSLMSLKILRRDQIYFVEKDRFTGASELYALDDFSPRKQEDIRKAYLLGRYGSVPSISWEADLWG